MAPRGVFNGNPLVEFLGDGRLVRVWGANLGVGNTLRLVSFRFMRPNGDTVTVEDGFQCDGTSTPRALWSITGGPFEGRNRNAALIHDWLYKRQATDSGPITRRAADRCFYEACRAGNGTWFSRMLKYVVVRLCSRGGWRPLPSLSR